MAILSALRIPEPKADEVHGPTRPLREIMAQPVFIVAVVVARAGLRRHEPAHDLHAARDGLLRPSLRGRRERHLART